MEILFKSPRNPQSLLNLHDAFAEDGAGTASALVHTLRDMTMLSSFRSLTARSKFQDAIRALYIQETIFRPLFETFNSDWSPGWRNNKVLQAAHEGLYTDGGIEDDFSTHGGMIGIIVLILVFQKTTTIFAQWEAMSKPRSDIPEKSRLSDNPRRWMVTNVIQLAKVYAEKWLLEVIRNRGMFLYIITLSLLIRCPSEV